jgi:nicotinamidase-related amidase
MKQALLVIDVQCGLFDAAPRPFEADLVVGRINALTPGPAKPASRSSWSSMNTLANCRMAPPTGSWNKTLAVPENDLRVRKTTPTHFCARRCRNCSRSAALSKLVVCGYACEFCVDTTVRRAAALGYPVILAADAHTTHDKVHAKGAQIRAHHNATLAGISSFGPVIEAKPVAEILFGRQAP